jgi:hypothetical protein
MQDQEDNILMNVQCKPMDDLTYRPADLTLTVSKYMGLRREADRVLLDDNEVIFRTEEGMTRSSCHKSYAVIRQAVNVQ